MHQNLTRHANKIRKKLQVMTLLHDQQWYSTYHRSPDDPISPIARNELLLSSIDRRLNEQNSSIGNLTVFSDVASAASTDELCWSLESSRHQQ
jgi:hypothetical protein